MSETKETKLANDKSEDWAVLAFDEAEDDARWAKLGGELNELLEKTVSTEKLTGTILMENDLSRLVSEKPNTENEEATDDELLF